MQRVGIASIRGTLADAVRLAQPRRPWLTRILLPGGILLAALGLLAYAGREALRPAIDVSVAPVVEVPSSQSPAVWSATVAEIVQAPGWIEADPYSTWVPALITGVVKEILVLEGDPVAAGQVVARLVDDDARLVQRRADAQLAQSLAALAQAEAKALSARAQMEDARESFRRFDAIVGGAVAEGEMIERRQRLAQMEAELAAANAAIEGARADIELARVARDEAALALARTEVRAAVAGVVLQRVVEPGQRVMQDANNPYAGTVLRLYDPRHLQVRVDVPLADSAKIAIGDEAEISTEMLPGRALKGRLTRFVHEANIQKNTVQVKLAILDPAPELKPEMLAKARIQGRASASAASSPVGGQNNGEVVLAPSTSVGEVTAGRAAVWVVDLRGPTVRRQAVRLGQVRGAATEILDGLKPGDRVVIAPPPELKDGVRIRPIERAQEQK